jgi:hypothetical protein
MNCKQQCSSLFTIKGIGLFLNNEHHLLLHCPTLHYYAHRRRLIQSYVMWTNRLGWFYPSASLSLAKSHCTNSSTFVIHPVLWHYIGWVLTTCLTNQLNYLTTFTTCHPSQRIPAYRANRSSEEVNNTFTRILPASHEIWNTHGTTLLHHHTGSLSASSPTVRRPYVPEASISDSWTSYVSWERLGREISQTPEKNPLNTKDQVEAKANLFPLLN